MKDKIGKSHIGIHPKSEFKKGHIPKDSIFKKGHKIHLGKKASIEARKNMSEGQNKYNLKNPESIKKRLSFNSPNKSELKLFSIINNIYPDEWKFVGDGSFVIDGKCPDYINYNKKQIIELYGERWHKPEEEEQRKELFKKFSYETLIIWFKELKNTEKLEEKLKLFINTNP